MGAVTRAEETRAVDALLQRARSRPAGLVIAGDAGIGKTTLWSAAVEQARATGFRILQARAGEAESVLAYTAIGDLLADVDGEVLASLSDLHRLALDRVLLRATADGPPTDQRVTSAALVSAVTAMTERGPVLLAVDDAQWLDSSSQLVLRRAARRLTGRVAVLLTERTSGPDAVAAAWLQLATPDAVARLRVRPMGLTALQALVTGRLGRAVPRPTLLRIADVSGGNPFFALELARAVDGATPGRDGRLPATLAEVVRARTAHYGEAVADVLLAASCVTDASVMLLARATGASTARVLELLGAPEREGVVVCDGTHVRFTHPLLARGVYQQAGPARRRRMHRALAEVESQPELRARHLALGTTTADAATLDALDGAARSAEERGAAAAAAELYELAIGLGGDTSQRRILAARQAFRSGQTARARVLVAPLLGPAVDDGIRQVAALATAGSLIYDQRFVEAVTCFEERVLPFATDALLLSRAHGGMAYALVMSGRHDEAVRHAAAAVACARRGASPAERSQALAIHVVIACALGAGRDEVALAEALDGEDVDAEVPAAYRARVADAITLAWTGRLEEGRAGLLAERRRCIERGSDADLVFVAGLLVMVNVWLGRYGAAEVIAEDMLARAQQAGAPHSIALADVLRAMVFARQGRDAAAREAIDAAIDGARRCGAPHLTWEPTATLAFLEVSRGRHAEALAVLAPLLAAFDPAAGTEITSAAHLPDAIEALVAVGRVDEAEPLIAALERNGSARDRPWMLAVAARGRAMACSARGDHEAAERAVHRAMAEHDRVAMPFERARTALFGGQVARRMRRKQLAARRLGEALTAFESLGAAPWADRARAELARVTVARDRASSLTPSESSVARLAAAGMTNRDIASALFITPKTVEHNLSRTYRKLGIRTRAELARHSVEFDD